MEGRKAHTGCRGVVLQGDVAVPSVCAPRFPCLVLPLRAACPARLSKRARLLESRMQRCGRWPTGYRWSFSVPACVVRNTGVACDADARLCFMCFRARPCVCMCACACVYLPAVQPTPPSRDGPVRPHISRGGGRTLVAAGGVSVPPTATVTPTATPATRPRRPRTVEHAPVAGTLCEACGHKDLEIAGLLLKVDMLKQRIVRLEGEKAAAKH